MFPQKSLPFTRPLKHEEGLAHLNYLFRAPQQFDWPSLEELVILSDLRRSRLVNSDNLPGAGLRPRLALVSLEQLGIEVEAEPGFADVIQAMAQHNVSPATMYELVAFAYGIWDRRTPVAALGSVGHVTIHGKKVEYIGRLQTGEIHVSRIDWTHWLYSEFLVAKN